MKKEEDFIEVFTFGDEKYMLVENVKNSNRNIIEQVEGKKYAKDSEYILAYIKCVHNYLVDTCKFDRVAEKEILLIEDKDKRLKEYKRRLSVSKLILDGVGVCKQFTALMSLLIMNNESGICKHGLDKKLECYEVNLIQVNASGKEYRHSIICVRLDGKNYYCDITKDVTFKERGRASEWCLLTAEEYKRKLKLYYNSTLKRPESYELAKLKVERDSVDSFVASLENLFSLELNKAKLVYSDMV